MQEKREKLAALEARITQLETENQWLRNLILEKDDALGSIVELRKTYNPEVGDKKGVEHKDGVGTPRLVE